MKRGTYTLEIGNQSIAFEIVPKFKTVTVASMNMTDTGLLDYRALKVGEYKEIECMRPRLVEVNKPSVSRASTHEKVIGCKCKIGTKCQCPTANEIPNSGVTEAFHVLEPVMMMIQRKDDKFCGVSYSNKVEV